MCHNRHTLLSLCLCALALAALGFVILTYEKEYLFRIQEQSLFLYTSDFLHQCITQPAGLLIWIGSYMTQFLYYPLLGTLLLLLCWALLMWMTCKTFRMPSEWSLLSLIPICTIVITVFHLGYWIFYLRMHGYFFASTIGMAAAIALLWTFCLLPHRFHTRTIFIPLAATIGYPLFGCYALIATLMMGIITWRLEGNSRTNKLIDTIIALLAVIATPLCYYHIFNRINIDDIWLAGIPAFQNAEGTFTPYYQPYLLLALWLLVGCILYGRQPKTKPIVTTLLQIVIFLTTAVFTYLNWYKDPNFHQELKMYRSMEQEDWEGLLANYQEAKSPTRLMWTMKNLALLRLGRQGDEMYHYRFGNKPAVAPFEARMLQAGGKLLYLNYGQANFCHRWCMEDGVEFGWRIEYLKCMATSMLLNGEKAAAQKYLRILQQTKYYKHWKGPDEKELKLMRRFMPEEDNLTNDNMLAEAFLMNHFANRDSNDPLVQEASLMFALQSCNKEVFLNRLNRYRELRPQKPIALHCQEALCIYQKTDSIPVDDNIRRRYGEFMSSASQYRGMNIEQVKPLMRDRFGDTFFFDYYFNNYQQP